MTIWLKPEPGIWSRYREWDGTMRTVTVAEHMADRRRAMAERLTRIHHNWRGEWRPWRLSVWWSPGYGGWAYRGYHAWLDRPGEHEWLRDPLFNPWKLLGLQRPMFDGDWREAFIKAYPAGHKNGHPRGACIVWRRGHHELSLTHPRKEAT